MDVIKGSIHEHRYQYLILGALCWEAFRNDANVVSGLFFLDFKEFDFDEMKENDMFCRIDFAVLECTAGQNNFKEFPGFLSIFNEGRTM